MGAEGAISVSRTRARELLLAASVVTTDETIGRCKMLNSLRSI